MTDDMKSGLFFLGFIILMLMVALYARRKRKHPECNTKCKFTGIAGEKYAQYYCPTCKKTFFMEHWNNNIG